jgi:type VI secretion system secreted protein VgrG
MLGSSAELRIVLGDEQNTYAGVVSSVRSLHHHGTTVRARLTVEPALAALRHGRDTRIFQDRTVAEVLQAVLTESLAPFGREARLELSRAYPKREYTVQYQESAFDFVHRLMEEEGILYYFEQGGAAETLVLIDAPQHHPVIEGGPLLEYSSTEGDAGVQEREYVRSFEPVSSVVGSAVATRHFDWTHPSAMITATASPAGPGDPPDGAADGPERESYQHDEQLTLHSYGGAYHSHDAADQIRLRKDTQARDSLRFEARSTVRAVRAGVRFDLNGHSSLAMNASYVVIGVRHYVGGHAAQSGLGDDSHVSYMNRFTTVLADKPYRPRRVRARPRIQGIQTAIVTGPPGEEIHCDEWGRVKVQFHWDRVGGYDERSSCWVRVMQTAAGGGFGAWVLPRVGWEVVVAFVDGDPDRPLVTGCVYNGDNPLPYPLPEKKAMTLFKSNSYPGGDGFNELRLDDSKGAEEIWLHGEKDWNTLINHDLTRDVLHDELQNVSNNRTRTVGVDETLSVGNDRVRSVTANETISIGQNRTETVGLNETLAVGINRVRTVGATETVTIGAVQTVMVGAAQSVTVGAARSHSVGANDELQVGANRALSVVNDQNVKVGSNEDYAIGASSSRKVGGNETEKVKGNRTRNVGKMETVTVGINQMINVGATRQVTVGAAHMMTVGGLMMVTAGLSFEIICGSSKLKMESGGKVTITGTSFEFVASGEVKIGGSMIHLN